MIGDAVREVVLDLGEAKTNLYAHASCGATTTTDKDTIHVFSLASGALYERFLRIMMLSVRKRTSMPSGHAGLFIPPVRLREQSI